MKNSVIILLVLLSTSVLNAQEQQEEKYTRANYISAGAIILTPALERAEEIYGDYTGLSVKFSHDISPRWRGHIVLTYLRGEGTPLFEGQGSTFINGSAEVALSNIEGIVSYQIPFEKWTLFLGAGIARVSFKEEATIDFRWDDGEYDTFDMEADVSKLGVKSIIGAEMFFDKAKKYLGYAQIAVLSAKVEGQGILEGDKIEIGGTAVEIGLRYRLDR